jgi:hypothetical protein
MAWTAASAFDQFKSRLLLTDVQKELVESRRDVTAGYVKSAFPSSSDLSVDRTKLIGSAQRETIIRPIEDIDLLAVFENKDAIFEHYRYDSRAFLYRMRDAINRYSRSRLLEREAKLYVFSTRITRILTSPRCSDGAVVATHCQRGRAVG